MTEASQKLYGGLDLHSSNVYCGILDQDGNPIFKKRLPTRVPEVLSALEPYQSKLVSIAVESTFNWYWLVDELMEAGYPVRLANPAAMQQYTGLKVTTDRSDAFWLAEMLRLGILPEGYIYPKNIRPVRDALRRRLLIRRQRTQMLLSLQSMLHRQRGLALSGKLLERWTKKDLETYFPDEFSRQTAWIMLQSIQKQNRLLKEMEGCILRWLKRDSGYQQLTGIPGIAEVLGMTIRLETGPIERFLSAGHYSSYCRMVRSYRDSNGKKKGENNRKNGNKYLGYAYIEAAHFSQRYDGVIQKWFDKKKAKTCHAVAAKALGCKLSKAVFYMLRDGTEFERGMMFG